MSKFDVFTPDDIVTEMQKYLPTEGRLLEPSVGEGALIRGLTGPIDVYDISAEYMAKIPDRPDITKYHSNFLTSHTSVRYARIISNPPFQRYQDMPEDMRTVVRTMHSCLAAGNIDLYVAFLVQCIQLLDEGGTFVVICPSTWMFNTSCREFRSFLYKNRLIEHIHDFGSTKVFPDADVYCAITVFSKKPKSSFTYNDKIIAYGEVLSPLSMVMLKSASAKTLADIAHVQNGIATLADKVFIHPTKLFDEPCWKPIYKVSKQKEMWAIVPYLPEETFKRENLKTYAFLETKRTDLTNRDKGKKTYPAWYSYGRQQGLNVPDVPESVYVSTLCNPDVAKSVVVRPTQLFYSGLRVTPKNGISCDTIVEIIANADLSSVCSKRSGDWLNVTASILKSIKIE